MLMAAPVDASEGQAAPQSRKQAAAGRLARAGRTAEAIKIYKEILAEEPDNDSAKKSLDQLIRGKSVISPAGPAQRKDDTQDDPAGPLIEQFRKEIVMIRIRGGTELSDAALKLYHRIDTLPQKNPRTYIALADIMLSFGKPDWAKKDAGKALEADPSSSDACFTLAKCYQSVGDFPAAVEQLEKAVKLDPRSFYARNNLGGLYMEMGKINEAVAQFQAAIEAKQDCSMSYFNMALALVYTKDYNKAILYLNQALKYAPTDMNAVMLLANIYFDQFRDFGMALPLYEKALQENPAITGRDALFLQGRIAECREAKRRKKD